MTPDRAQLIRAAAASAAAALRVQGAAGHRGWAAADLSALCEQLEQIERHLLAGPSQASASSTAAGSAHVQRPAPASALAPALVSPAPAPAPALESPAPAPAPAPAPVSPAASAPSASQPWLESSTLRTGAPVSFDLRTMLATGTEGLERVRATMGDCRRCGLCDRRTNIVFGVGNASARLMFVGEGPGAEEDAQGEPFVGRAGELLNRMIAAMGLRRDEIYIANVVKCRPPENREPSVTEVAQCLPFLKAQIASVSPEVIVTLGRSALQALSGKPVTMRSSRGRWLDLEGIAVMPTYHPAYILRLRDNELLQARREAWTDLQAVMAKLGLRAPGRGDAH